MRKSFFAMVFLLLTLSLTANSKELFTNYLLKAEGHKSTSLDSFFMEKSQGIRQLNHQYKFANLKQVSLDDANLEILLKKYGHEIEYIEKDQVINLKNTVSYRQWGLENTNDIDIDILDAWKINTGSKSVVVGVIDTGVDYNHNALNENMWINSKEKANGIDDDGNGFVDDIHGYDFVNMDGDPLDDNQHGTHCAGIIGANSTEIKGAALNVKIMALKFLSASGSGSLSAAIQAIEYGVDNGANILSNSWGGGGYSQALYDAIEYAKNNNVLFIAAAGNEYRDNDRYPAYPASYNIDNVISVGAIDRNGYKPGFSNYGQTSVHLFAPGKDIYSTVPNNRGAYLSGTSMATPFVSGVAALVLSEYPWMNYLDIKTKILDNVVKRDNLVSRSITGGILNAHEALR